MWIFLNFLISDEILKYSHRLKINVKSKRNSGDDCSFIQIINILIIEGKEIDIR